MARPHRRSVWLPGPGSRASTWIVAGTLAAGCGGSRAVAPSTLPECTSATTLAVTTGTTPRFSWTPVCRAYYLIVEAADGEDRWMVMTPGTNGIGPVVAYGVVPAGAQQLVPPTLLVAGQPYQVALTRYLGPEASSFLVVARQSFTP